LEAECRAETQKWIEQHRPEVVITGFHLMNDWLSGYGLEVPGDIGLVHYSLADDTPGWSGVDPDAERIGEAAVDLLTAHILRNEYGTPEQPKLMRFGGRWVEGDTTRRVREVETPQDVEPPGYSHSLEWYDRELF
jgi:DNA-binding LacI/PurR family transcriptional regulator